MKTVYHAAIQGRVGKVQLEINADLGRELTKREMEIINKAGNDLENALYDELMITNQTLIESARQERVDILALFESKSIYVEEIPNGYWGNDAYAKIYPWYLVTTEKGRIKIGWRKRVIYIDWADSAIWQKADDLFPNEDVTKGDKYIHAWGYEKAKQYIDTLLSVDTSAFLPNSNNDDNE